MSFAQSILRSASITRCTSVAVMAADHTIITPAAQVSMAPRSRILMPSGSLEPFGDEFVTGVNVDHLQQLWSKIAELVRRERRHNENLARVGFDLFISDCEQDRA